MEDNIQSLICPECDKDAHLNGWAVDVNRILNTVDVVLVDRKGRRILITSPLEHTSIEVVDK